VQAMICCIEMRVVVVVFSLKIPIFVLYNFNCCSAVCVCVGCIVLSCARQVNPDFLLSLKKKISLYVFVPDLCATALLSRVNTIEKRHTSPPQHRLNKELDTTC